MGLFDRPARVRAAVYLEAEQRAEIQRIAKAEDATASQVLRVRREIDTLRVAVGEVRRDLHVLSDRCHTDNPPLSCTRRPHRAPTPTRDPRDSHTAQGRVSAFTLIRACQAPAMLKRDQATRECRFLGDYVIEPLYRGLVCEYLSERQSVRIQVSHYHLRGLIDVSGGN